MKRLLWALPFLFVLRPACAIQMPQAVYQVINSTFTNFLVNVASSSIPGATQMDSPQLAGRKALVVTNLDTTANLWCSLVTTAPVTNAGAFISPKSFRTWAISDNGVPDAGGAPTTAVPFKLWCITDKAGATCPAWVEQGR